MEDGMVRGSVVDGLGVVSIDLLTCFLCVGLWVTFWSCLDSLQLPEMLLGCIAVVIVSVLGVFSMHKRLEKASAQWRYLLVVVMIWLWTFFLVALGIFIWRAAFAGVHWLILPPDNDARAILLASVGSCILLATSSFKSACDATPVGFVADSRYHGERFATPSYSVVDSDSEMTIESQRARLLGVVLDMSLTLPVVFVWAGVWIIGDNHNVPPLSSFIVCSFTIALLSFFEVEQKIVSATRKIKADVVLSVVQALWTASLTVLCIMTWRGLWESLTALLQLAVHPLREAIAEDHTMLALTALLAFVFATLLASLGRFRSALFPPMDFSKDYDISSDRPSSKLTESRYEGYSSA
jgi:hypothetical protein